MLLCLQVFPLKKIVLTDLYVVSKASVSMTGIMCQINAWAFVMYIGSAFVMCFVCPHFSSHWRGFMGVMVTAYMLKAENYLTLQSANNSQAELLAAYWDR